MLEIKTLGDFDIRLDDKSILKIGKRATKALDLLKYFIANKDRKLSPESIIEIQWGNSNSEDPKNVLRTQIFRLRKDLNEMGLMYRADKEDYFSLAFENGYYIFRMSAECKVDALVFEDCIKEADNIKNEDSDTAIEKYLEAIELYKGEYLAGSPYNEWMYIARNRYHRLFVHALLKLFEILSSKGYHSKIIEIFEQVIVHEPYDESLHIYLIETLLELNQIKNAISHYNYITGKMYREMSIKPSPALKRTYQKIASVNKGEKIDIDYLNDDLTNDDLDGALYCDADYFKVIYNLERRRALRMNTNVFLGLVTILGINKNMTHSDQAFYINNLKDIIKNSIRKGDAFSQINNYQVAFLLTDTREENLKLIRERIEHKFMEEIDDKHLQLKFSIRPISSPELFVE